MKTFLEKLSLSAKMTFLSTILILIFITHQYLELRDNVRTNLKNQVSIAMSLVDGFYQEFKSGKISEDDAKKLAMEATKTLRYGSDGKDYFWIHDLNLVMLMHPYSTALVGKDISDFKDVNGMTLFKEMNERVKEAGEGYVEYFWALKDQQNTVAKKISFVKGFAPWGWVVGTGRYEQDDNFLIEVILFLLIIPFIYFIGVFLERSIRKSFKMLQFDLKNIKEKSKIDYTFNIDSFPPDVRPIISEVNAIFQDLKIFFDEMNIVFNELANGVVGETVTKEFRGDQKKIQELVNQTSLNLFEIVKEIKVSSQRVNAGAEQVAGASVNLSRGAMNQASSIEEISSTLNELKKKTKETTQNVIEASKLSSEAKESAMQGDMRMKEMLKSMAEINSSSENVTKIIKVIDEIAFQTNLLSLNAAVEAARAGKYGKGFAVVAQEVRTLAQKSAEAARETTAMIEESKVRVDKGAVTAADVAKYLETIAGTITSVNNNLQEISESAKNQDESISQIGEAMENISKSTETNVANIEQASSGAQKLFAEVQSLTFSISNFKLSGEENSSGAGAALTSMKKAGGTREFITWNEKLSVKIDSIDSQHKNLVRMVNKLHRLMSDGDTNNELATIFNELVQYAATHFKFEEDIFDKYKYENTDEHKDYHEKLVGQVLDFKKRFDSGEAALSFDLMTFLKDWLINHIMGEDNKYIKFMQSNGVK